jgi:hypothetical protein
MKRIYIFLLLLCGLSSCKKFLATNPADTVTTANYYQNATQLNAALTTIYSRLIMYGYGNTGQTLNCNLIYSDEAIQTYNNLGTNSVPAYVYDYTNTTVGNLWTGMYSTIYYANLMAANIGSANVDTGTRNYILAQALFMRGYAYYVLGSHYGGVPLRVGPTSLGNTDLARASLADTYGQAVSDIEAAIPELKTAAVTGTSSRISQTAAEGILARVFLTMAGTGPIGLGEAKYYDSTIYYAQQVVGSGQHSLYTGKQGVTTPDSSFAYIFINEARQIVNYQECMWEATFSGNDNTSTYTFQGTTGWFGGIPYQTTYNDASIGYCFNAINTPRTLYTLFGTGDQRRDWTIAPYYYGGTASSPSTSAAGITKLNYASTNLSIYARSIGKWRREFETYTPKSKYSSPESFPILRYSDVLLMLAEAELEAPSGDKADALNRVNMIRRRAYGVNINTANATSDLASLALTDIVDERERELCFEAVRWVDIRRWGIYQSKMQALQAQMAADGLPAATYLFIGAPGNRTMTYSNAYQYIATAVSSDKFELLPIPSSELTVNNLCTQNPGW